MIRITILFAATLLVAANQSFSMKQGTPKVMERIEGDPSTYPENFERRMTKYIQEQCISDPITIEPILRHRLLQEAPKELRKMMHRLENPITAFPNLDFTPFALFLLESDYQSEKILAHAFAQKFDRPSTCIDAAKLATEYRYSGSNNLMRAINPILQKNAPHVFILNKIDQLGDSIYENPEEYSRVDYAIAALYDHLENSNPRNVFLFLIAKNHFVFSERTRSRFITHFDRIPSEFPITIRQIVLQHFLSQKEQNTSKFPLYQLAARTNGYSYQQLQSYINSDQFNQDLANIEKIEARKRMIFLLAYHGLLLSAFIANA